MSTVLENPVVRRPQQQPPLSPSYVMPDFGVPWPFPITHLPNGWGVSIAEIGPDLAARMLEKNSERQRNLRESQVYKLADEMMNRWRLTHEGLAYNSKGEGVDGRTRLSACVHSGVPFKTLVFFGMDNVAEIGIGKPRSIADTAKFAGIEDITATNAATMRAFLFGVKPFGVVYSNPYLLEQMQHYKPMILFTNYSNHRLMRAPVRGAIGRALYHAEPDALRRFIDVLTDKEPATGPGERYAVALRGSMTTTRRLVTSRHDSCDLYCRAQRAILGYLEGETPNKLYAVQTDLFPLPTDDQIATTHALLDFHKSE